MSYAQKAGIVSYQFDGLEDIFTISKINEYEPSDFRILDVNKTDLAEKREIKYGEPVLR